MMVKRSTERSADGGNQAYLKRQKIKHVPVSTEEIQSSSQLHQLLAFDQDVGRARHGIQSLKVFLESFLEEDSKKKHLPILKDYLLSQILQDDDDKAVVYLDDIMQTWSFASQSNNESLLSAVPAVLALLFRTLSSILELAPCGLRLGRTLLQKHQLELISRGLTSSSSKEYIISPTLRLVREITALDGGVLAKEVYRARDYTFRALARNIGIRHVGNDAEDPRKPSVRTHALRFLLTCMKFFPTRAKNELFGLRDIISGITRDISSDPPHLLVELLETLKVQVLQDETILRGSKSKLLHPINLGRIASLYGYGREDNEIREDPKSVRSLAHEFLILACTAPNTGILYQKTGFYPWDLDLDEPHNLVDPSFIDLGLDSLEWGDKFTENVPVRNTILSEFIQSLRPWSDTKQSELLVAIFKAAPELVADYFFRKKSFTFEPKLTATWIGYSTLLFSVIQLPVPSYFGHEHRYGRVPPPSSILIESILPQPFTQRALTRCLNQKSSLVSFFAFRMLIIAFQKLKDVLSRYRKAAETGSLIWNQAQHQLTEVFCQRCPAMRDVIIAFNSISKENLMQRQAASRLLVLYYEVVPQIALESKFDVSARLTETLRLLEERSLKGKDHAIRMMEVENLFEIAHFSPGTRWFNKPESFPNSPFAAMLHLSVQASSEFPLPKIRQILDSVISENDIMQLETRQSSQDALLYALKACNGTSGSQHIYDFLDNCVLRCATTPIKYIDALEQYYGSEYGSKSEGSGEQTGPISLLLLAIAEQWPFVTKSPEMEKVDEIAKFIASYVAASIKILEDKKIIKAIVKTLVTACPEGSKARKVVERTRKLVGKLELPELPVSSPILPDGSDGRDSCVPEDQIIANIEASMLQVTVADVDDHSALTRWTTRDIDEAIEEGHAAALIMLLCSPHLSARKEAISNIAKLAVKLKNSSYREREQVWILLSEVLETARPYIAEQPLPTTICAFSSHAISVLCDPLHCLYPKVNEFLIQGPAWELEKLPLLNAILNDPPSIDDAHYSEVSFLLTYLALGLRNPADMAIFHKRHVFERLLSLYNNVYLGKGLKEKILRILWKATAVEGGSTTLITRFGILSWLQAQMTIEDGNKGLKVLRERVLKTCDEKKLKAWSHRTVADFLAES